MDTAINMQSVYVTDLVGIAILVIIMVTRGWSLPGRKLESRIMMVLLAVSMFNCVADIYVFQCDGIPGPGYRVLAFGFPIECIKETDARRSIMNIAVDFLLGK